MLVQILRENRNYRYTWFGQVVSEVGDHFNNIAVFSLALSLPRSEPAGIDPDRVEVHGEPRFTG